MIETEIELVSKLFLTGHLNVAERAGLPNGKVRASVARSLIAQNLEAVGWFPGDKGWAVGDAGGEYIQLEKKPDGSAVLHMNTESSYCQYSHQTEEYSVVGPAINAFIISREKQDLDWLKVDWNE